MLRQYIPNKQQLVNLGFPTMVSEPGCAMIYNQAFRRVASDVGKGKEEWAEFERSCCRCGQPFYVTESGEYLSEEPCLYHDGKIQSTEDFQVYLSCCKGLPTSEGCTAAKAHVWTGLTSGVNGPLPGYVCSAPRVDGVPRVYAVDCEMCYTSLGLELSRVTLVNLDGDVVYNSLVLPDRPILDHNTRFSGICDEDYRVNRARGFLEAQQDLLQWVKADTILLGHGLENDLRALKLIHPLVVDTAILYPHQHGFPFRRSLANIAQDVLKKKIREGGNGHHDSEEDAKTCLALVLEKLSADHKLKFVKFGRGKERSNHRSN